MFIVVFRVFVIFDQTLVSFIVDASIAYVVVIVEFVIFVVEVDGDTVIVDFLVDGLNE